MNEHSYQDYDDVLPEEPNGELVQWMEPRPLTFGPAGLSLAVGGAFALGLATAMIAVGLARLAGVERRTRPFPVQIGSSAPDKKSLFSRR